MKKYTFEDIRDKGLLLYEYVRGSVSQGINTKSSDIDHGGVYLAPAEQLLGLGIDYQDEIKSEKGDDDWMELNKFMRLLLKSNPTVLESLFIDDKYVLYEHPIMTEIKKHRNEFITKECFDAFFGYARCQVHKARGLNKKIVQPIVERKTVLDFCYTFYKQGSTKIENWLDYRGLKQKYCGLVNIPNMMETIGVYYDWGNHFLNENVHIEELYGAYDNIGTYSTTDIITKMKKSTDDSEKLKLEEDLKKCHMCNMVEFIMDFYHLDDMFALRNWYYEQRPIGYKGIVNEKGTSNELRLSSVAKDEKPVCYMTYNKNAFSSHCKDYKEYKDWEKNRNPVRYESNLNKNYDAKNMAHSFRLVNMGIEIARGEGVKVDRTNIDRDFLLEIRNHQYEYDELIYKLEEKVKEMDEAVKQTSLPDKIDINRVNDLLLQIRKTQLQL